MCVIVYFACTRPPFVAMAADCVQNEFCLFFKSAAPYTTSYASYNQARRSVSLRGLLTSWHFLLLLLFQSQNIPNTSSKCLINTFEVNQLQHEILVPTDGWHGFSFPVLVEHRAKYSGRSRKIIRQQILFYFQLWSAMKKKTFKCNISIMKNGKDLMKTQGSFEGT